jgi:hypothetical protein
MVTNGNEKFHKNLYVFTKMCQFLKKEEKQLSRNRNVKK